MAKKTQQVNDSISGGPVIRDATGNERYSHPRNNAELIPLAETIPERFRRETEASLPRLVAEAGAGAAFAWDEFFSGQMRNIHTRAAYSRAVRLLLDWLEFRGVPLANVTPGMIGSYFDQLKISAPSKKLALAPIRRFSMCWSSDMC